ncbi:hypothetical protein A2W54_00235 [Candidatus Giovannonibacteria bacterium RIFCSPHIGHO2_02_43_13]|uniref:Uncharacterized protein n=1 Tax=Candidatus Giovannonibacteria bacterium RIFCSPHIGHO2_02_43_13 TaxID=1798330 RepID=A0A1F5WPX1_9BACT|nr:MAG: hypothetical protein UW28_C0005G0020 [Parcubacteria group bacterium GW2011_GWA2_44_13]OGF72376.1 MAG: hypothetical protein A3E06_02500 [Candidatus Giovannonibacteria bacterium RIFCSPHIGHO2_12_FULL_44_42]OGF77627.1 MAG: hypothetical protein A2W54_00235 [Candidatus Giovannonibacteria bacterium RIFCSPHIGHO2_02_43_13]OGF89197.1 MAG: hypothetical protein A3I94_00610 [Candidatus Giovannonibacteria bacterium RIFCSPLOWO2_02_FULL_43_54]OGF97018.1 MAG: hypothetical protein A3H08_03800 [Candidatus
MKIRGAVLSILLVLSATLSFWVWEKILEKPFLSLAILGYAVVFGFFLLLVKNKVLFWAIPPLTLLLSVFFFTPEINFFYGLILGVAVILYAAELKREEEHSNLKILLKRVLGNSIKTFFTGLAIFFAFIYYGTIYRNPDPAKLLLPESVFETTLKLVEPLLRDSIPGFNASDKKLSHTLYELTYARINDYAKDYTGYIPMIAAASFFFALKTVSVLFYYLSIILIYFLIKLLIIGGLIKKELVPETRETLV